MALKTKWNVTYLSKVKQFDTIKVIFKTEELPKQHSTETLGIAAVVLLHTYLGRQTSRFNVGEISPDVNADFLVADTCFA